MAITTARTQRGGVGAADEKKACLLNRSRAKPRHVAERPLLADIVAKVFWDDERKFLEPLLHFARAATWGTNQEEWAQATPA